jgi:hypothetical protein
MASQTYFKFTHKCDIYTKSTSVNAAGQQFASYTIVETIPFQFQSPSTSTSSGDERRLAPYQESIPKFEALVPKGSDVNIVYGSRIQNIKDRKGTVVDNSVYEVVGIQPKFSITGLKHHTVVTLRRVVETA